MIDPATLCRQHLVAEHHECHVFLGKLKAQHRVDGYIGGNLLEVESLYSRHEELVAEMEARGYKHDSPMGPIEAYNAGLYIPKDLRTRYIDKDRARVELHCRCQACQTLWKLKN